MGAITTANQCEIGSVARQTGERKVTKEYDNAIIRVQKTPLKVKIKEQETTRKC